MKNWYLIILLITSISTNNAYISTETITKETPQEVATYIYGPQTLNVPVTEYQKIEKLLIDLNNITPEQKKRVISLILASLENELEKTNSYIKEQYEKQHEVSLSVFFKTFILKHQIDYLKKLHDDFLDEEGFVKRSINWITSTATTVTSWVANMFEAKSTQTNEEMLAGQVSDYIYFERENILFDYHKQLLFFTSIEKVPLPDIINFWHSKKLHHQMYLRALQITDRVVPQFGIDTIIDFAIQGVLMAGGSMAIQWVDEDDAKTFEGLEKQQNKIQQGWQTFMSNIQKDAKQVMSTVLSSFKTSLDSVQKEYTASNQLMQNEVQYLMRSLSLAQPKQVYLVAPMNYDLSFEASPMVTPAPHAWYNIAQIGDWEYDPNTNSFWQNGLQLFGVPAWKTDPKTKKPGSDVPAFNSIFTESILNGSEYEVEAECTIYTCSGSPFFVGVMFNKARWLSGDPERLTGYRLFGLYGTEKTPGDITTRSIDGVFAEQQIIPAKDTTQKEQILSPMQLIDTQPTTHFATNIVSADDLKVLSVEPLAFVLHVSTKPDSVTCTISKQETDTKGNASLKQIAQKTLQGLNTYTFLYHGIGFMAPGCQASFKLTKPVELVYTQDQIKAYKPPIQS